MKSPIDKITSDAPESRSADVVADNLHQLAALFPEAFSEGKVDFEVLRELLGDAVEEGAERYGLNWNGKRAARRLALTPSNGTLRPCPGESVDWESTQNLMIEGDNLEVLKLLQKSYTGKVKLIYIDPPYNTGKDFVYPDNYQDSIKNYLELTGQIEGGRKISSNVETSGRFHTDWLNMMYPRLMLARNLLTDDGLICISMDDHEIHNLRSLCDEIFGQESFIGMLTWITTTQPDNIGRARFGLQQNIEYVLMYSKCSRLELPPFLLRSTGRISKYPHKGKFGSCRFEIIERAFEGAYARKTMRFNILGQAPRHGKQWQIGETQARELEKTERVEIVDGIVKRAVYPEDELDDATGLEPFWAFLREVKTSQAGKADITNLLGNGHGIDTVKPTSLLAAILDHLPSKSTVLDFFAGSGTSAHAVMEANVRDQGERRAVLVQIPARLSLSQNEQRSSALYCDSIGKPRTLAELTKERLRRAGKKIKADNPLFHGDLGFRVFRLDSSNIREWDPDAAVPKDAITDSILNLKTDRGESDILYEVLLKLGLDLTVPIETRSLGGAEVHSIGGGVLMVCLTEEIKKQNSEKLALGICDWHTAANPAGEVTVVFRDSAFPDDVVKTNLCAILKQHGLANLLSI